MNVKKQLDLLGLKCEDKVTGLKGVIVSISFDLYGCVQLLVKPPIDKEGKVVEAYWFDANRIKIIGRKPVIETPNFEYDKGPANKPIF